MKTAKRNGVVKPSDEVLNILRRSRVEGNLLHLPPERLSPADYKAVKVAIEAIGGRWKGGKVQAHVFEGSPVDALSGLLDSGETVDKKQALGFFETPAALAAELVERGIVLLEHKVLEPSAGRGAILRAIRAVGVTDILAVEVDPAHFPTLIQLVGGDNVRGGDFLQLKPSPVFDRVIANPPFAKGADIDHIRRMFEWLKPGGRLVSVMAAGVLFRTAKKQTDFCNWVDSLSGDIEALPDGSFKASGTTVSTCVVTIDKPIGGEA